MKSAQALNSPSLSHKPKYPASITLFGLHTWLGLEPFHPTAELKIS